MAYCFRPGKQPKHFDVRFAFELRGIAYTIIGTSPPCLMTNVAINETITSQAQKFSPALEEIKIG